MDSDSVVRWLDGAKRATDMDAVEPANDKDKKVKICDFSLSHDRHEKAMAVAELTGVGVGTPGWVSPEEVITTTPTELWDVALS